VSSKTPTDASGTGHPGRTTVISRITSNLSWSEGLRALLCMLPMLVAVLIGEMTYIVAIGQGGFFFSSLLLPNRISGRLIMGSILIALGMGFYLMGGTVAPIPWLAVVFTFFAALNLSFLTSWRIGGPLALSIVMIYTAGLNTGSPEKAAANFLAFALVMAWSTLVSMLPFWKPMMPPKPKHDPSNAELAEQGFRMGIGTSLALAVSYIFEFAKIGWAVSAVGSIVRFDPTMSKQRAWARAIGTVGGAIIAGFLLVRIESITALVLIGVLFAVLNGLYKKAKIGQMPLFYTATILILYSLNDLQGGKDLAFMRLVYNIVGVLIAVVVVLYPFPFVTRRLRRGEADLKT
jgi:hypothetical protein